MTEDAAEYVGDGSAERPMDVEVTVRPVSDGPPTVTILVQRTSRGWICKCCPPESMTLANMTARGESLSEALAALAELVEAWEEEQDEDEDYDDDGAEFDDDE